MARLRVAQVVLSLSPGGTERLVVELVRRTVERCETIVCCLDHEGAWGAELAREGVPVISLARQPGFQPSLGWRLAAHLRRNRCQVLHCHQYTPYIYGGIAAVLAGARIVFTEHGRLSDVPPSRKRQFLNPVIARLGGALFSVSHDLRRHMIAEGMPANRVGVIHNGVDPGLPVTPERRLRARLALDLSNGDTDFVVGTAARLDPVKDLGTLITAFAGLRRHRRSARLVILGDGPELGRLSDVCHAHGLDGTVVFAGHRPDVRELLPALDVFVNSSTSEGISLTILEAMATALPVVATSVGGTPEVVVTGDTGILVPSRDPAALGQALVELSVRPQWGVELGLKGRTRVLDHFTIDRMIADYLSEYERAARRSQ